MGSLLPAKTLELPVLLRVSVCVRARAEVDTSAGRLSEANTQRRPRALEREREREGGGRFPLLFRCFRLFLSSRVKRPSGPRPADTERTPTHTPFHRAKEPPGRSLSLSRFFPFGRQNPSSRRQITRTARVRNHRPKTDHTHKSSPFPVLLRVFYTPDI